LRLGIDLAACLQPLKCVCYVGIWSMHPLMSLVSLSLSFTFLVTAIISALARLHVVFDSVIQRLAFLESPETCLDLTLYITTTTIQYLDHTQASKVTRENKPYIYNQIPEKNTGQTTSHNTLNNPRRDVGRRTNGIRRRRGGLLRPR
jgi:hypothetical protein